MEKRVNSSSGASDPQSDVFFNYREKEPLMAEKEQAKEKDVDQVVRYLTTTFNKAKTGTDRAFRGKTVGPNKAYIIETEFAYRLNEVMRGPRCMLQKNIAECNDFIDQVVSYFAQEKPSTTTTPPPEQPVS